MPDPLGQLAQWRETTEKATPGEMYHGGAAAKRFEVTARTAMPRLLAAVQAVLDTHRLDEARMVDVVTATSVVQEAPCTECGADTYPCLTVRAITDALGGCHE